MNDLQKIIKAKAWNFIGPGFSTPYWTTIEVKTTTGRWSSINLPTWIVFVAMEINTEKLAKIFTGKSPLSNKRYLSGSMEWIKENASKYNLSVENVMPYVLLGTCGAGEKEKWIMLSKLVGKRINFHRREDAGTSELKRTYFPIGFSIYRQHWPERFAHRAYWIAKYTLIDFQKKIKGTKINIFA